MAIINRHLKKNIGHPPGTLFIPDPVNDRKCRITYISYNRENYTTREVSKLDDVSPEGGEKECLWIHIEAIDDLDIINQLGSRFGISNMILEDILNTTHRPKLETDDSYLFAVIKNYSLNSISKEIEHDQISIYYSKNNVISIQKTNNPTYRMVEERIIKNKGIIRKKSCDYLFYCLLDVVIDNYFVVTDYLSEKISAVEQELLFNPDKITLNKLYHIKNDILMARNSINPLREIIGSLKISGTFFVNKKDLIFINDLYDHVLQIIDTINTLREITSNMFDLYLSVTSNRMNEIMKVLTTIGTIFIPLTFIAGIYGMNFRYMPELEYRYSYPILIILLFSAAGGMLLFFKKKKWF